MRQWLVLHTAPFMGVAWRSRCALHDHCPQSDTDCRHEPVPWSTASLGTLLGGLASERTNHVGLVHAVIGLLIFGITLTFFLNLLGHTERYLPKNGSPQLCFVWICIPSSLKASRTDHSLVDGKLYCMFGRIRFLCLESLSWFEGYFIGQLNAMSVMDVLVLSVVFNIQTAVVPLTARKVEPSNIVPTITSDLCDTSYIS